MHRSRGPSTRPHHSILRRQWHVALCVSLAVTPAAVLTGGAPAQAAVTTVCADRSIPEPVDSTTRASRLAAPDSRNHVFAADTSGAMWLYEVLKPDTASSSLSTPKRIGSGWQQYGLVLGGPGGRLYGIKSTGVYRYRWIDDAWESTNGAHARQITPGMGAYATAAYRNKITVDRAGDFYLIDGAGLLRWYRYDEAGGNWTHFGRVIDTGWNRYNLIVAADEGVIYARTATGALHRHYFDNDGQRWLAQNQVVGSGWNSATKGILSLGGDTLFQIPASGDFLHYRYREDNSSWTLQRRDIGDKFHTYANVATRTDSCWIRGSRTPQRPSSPSTPTVPATPIKVIQASPRDGQALGDIEYAYTDALGRLVYGSHSADNESNLRWSVVSGHEAFTGSPNLVSTGGGQVHIFGHHTSSDTWGMSQTSATERAWQPWVDLGGEMKPTPAAVRLSDDSIATFGVDGDGGLWVRAQTGAGGHSLPWRKLADPGLAGDLVGIASTDRAATLVGTDSAGALWTGTYQDGSLTSSATLGGTNFIGPAALVPVPGRKTRLFARNADGQVMTSWLDGPDTWTPITGLAAAGSPSAVLSPATGLIYVVARDSEGVINVAVETAQASGQWGPWIPASTDAETYPTDPTAFTYTKGEGTHTGYLVRSRDNQVRSFRLINEASLLARPGARAATAKVKPVFEQLSLPQPPR